MLTDSRSQKCKGKIVAGAAAENGAIEVFRPAPRLAVLGRPAALAHSAGFPEAKFRTIHACPKDLARASAAA